MPQRPTHLFTHLSPGLQTVCNWGFLLGFVQEASVRAESSQGVMHGHRLVSAVAQVLSWPPQNAHRSQGKKLALLFFCQSPSMGFTVVV